MNDDGKSGWSQVVTYRTKADLAGAPTKPSVKGRVLGNMFRLSWGKCVRVYVFGLLTGSRYVLT